MFLKPDLDTLLIVRFFFTIYCIFNVIEYSILLNGIEYGIFIHGVFERDRNRSDRIYFHLFLGL